MSNSISLYKLTDQYLELQHLADEDIPLEAIADTLDGLQGEIELKATNVCAFTLNLEAFAAAARDAGKKLIDRAARIEKRAEAMREYVRSRLAAVGIKKVEGPEFTITRKANPPKVLIADGAKVPPEYLAPPDPLVARIAAAVTTRTPSDTADLVLRLNSDEAQEFATKYVVITFGELLAAIDSCMPERSPDKKKIAETLKPIYKAHEEALAAAARASQPTPVRPDPLPGCALEQGERLEIRT